MQVNSGAGRVSVRDLFDRGAVLFIGMATGAVLLFSFQTDGRPLNPILSNRTPKAPPPAAAGAVKHPVAQECHDDFPFSQRVITGLRANRPLRIGVLGDSFGEGLWAVTDQHFRKSRDFVVYRLSREGTGFTRYRTTDLLEDLKSKLARQPIDIALIDFGANDTQGVWQNGHGADYMSPRWQATIGARVADYVGFLHNHGVAVGWLGLPRMRKADYDNDVQAMNGFYTGLMCRLHVPFVNPVAVSEDRMHGFAQHLVDPATREPYLARAEDGVHMTFHGYDVIARPLFQRLAVLTPRAAGDVPGSGN